ncbi:hypothetical protein SAMN04488494_1183 [Xylanibacter ruminicola]|uniref:Glycosyl transferase family 2 n=1 Tax=Xylanibacter ruminicola TaxID=839 RepID=A0A1M7FKV8_XYLRU|nr:hypothetical protein [Xylanibacter ruminicola]SHM04277.1 hypothetical protein SAMN04488494_1183 [Xylanibacter ruminicola]
MNEELSYEHKVCVECFTYNQSLYIEDALDGFCMQHTTFPYVCVIIDDASTDGEQKVLTDYLKRNFNLNDTSVVRNEDYVNYSLVYAQHKNNENCYFAVIFLKYNHYSKALDKTPYFSEWHNNSKYLAFCEGDDFWIDSHKLQKQVDFLEVHTDYTMFFHNAIIRYENQTRPDRILSQFETGDFDTLLLFKKWQLPLASVLLRRQILDSPLLTELNKVYKGSFCLFITATKTGKVFGLSESLSVYRINDGGVSNKMHAWDILDRRYKYAKVTKDDTIIKYVDSIALRRLIEVMPHYLLGNSEAKKLANVVKYHNKRVYYQSIIVFPLCFPKLVLDKIKSQYDKKKRSNR